MTDKVIKRRNKQTLNIDNENINTATRKRKQQRNNLFHFRYLLKSIYVIIGLGILFSLYKILIGFIYVEHTNIPINLPKLVNEKIPERFWGTYRSNLYFGLKHRSEKSLSGGLMWFDYDTLQKSHDRFLR
jgi:hypothetical protein